MLESISDDYVCECVKNQKKIAIISNIHTFSRILPSSLHVDL